MYKCINVYHPQISLLREAYKGTCVAEEDVVYVEAHGTGTQAGDTQECLAVDNFFCKKRNKVGVLFSV